MDIIELAMKHLGENYVFGVLVPKDDANYTGPWDCAEFASWCLYQTTGVLFGVDQHNDPHTADAYTGYWLKDAKDAGALVEVEDAINTRGAFLLRFGVPGQGGHIAISDGQGGTVEAHSHVDGVIQGEAEGRFNYGIKVAA